MRVRIVGIVEGPLGAPPPGAAAPTPARGFTVHLAPVSDQPQPGPAHFSIPVDDIGSYVVGNEYELVLKAAGRG